MEGMIGYDTYLIYDNFPVLHVSLIKYVLFVCKKIFSLKSLVVETMWICRQHKGSLH